MRCIIDLTAALPYGLTSAIHRFGIDFNTVLLRYGSRWRQHRRIFHQAFRADAAPKYRPMQQRKSHQLLLAIFEDPEACFEHLHTYALCFLKAKHS